MCRIIVLYSTAIPQAELHHIYVNSVLPEEKHLQRSSSASRIDRACSAVKMSLVFTKIFISQASGVVKDVRNSAICPEFAAGGLKRLRY